MLEFYLISVLGKINGFTVWFLTILSMLLVVYLVFFPIIKDEFNSSTLKRTNKYFIVSIIVLMLLNLLIPSKKEILMIFGVGGAIDYLKSNDKAKQIPDKCLMLIDKFIDEELNEN